LIKKNILLQNIKLIFYIFFVILLTLIHNIYFYLSFFLILILLDLNFFIRKIKRVISTIILFNFFISLTFLIFVRFDLEYILLINLRVLSITYLTFYFISHINLFNCFSFSKELSFLLVVTYSQILNFIKVFSDLKEAFESRTLKKEKKYLKLLPRKAVNLFFTKSIYNAKETSLAMRSRGLIND